MHRISLRTVAVLSIFATLSVPLLAQAGQVRVDAGGPGTNVFVPVDVTVNAGDQVMWVWVGRHSVTSGSVADCLPDMAFDTGTLTATASVVVAYSRRFTSVDPSIEYYCDPHCFEGMVGTVRVVASGAPVADFRITEVQTDVAGNLDLIEITNMGSAVGDLGRCRILSSPSDTAMVPAFSWPVNPGQRVTVHVAAAGTQSIPSQMYLPTLSALQDAVGHVVLLTPNSVNNSTFDASQMIDYVQWGSASGQSRESAAVTAGLWTTGHFVPTPAAGQSMQFCGSASDHGQTFWAAAASTFGAVNDCTTPATTTSWGRLKVIYR